MQAETKRDWRRIMTGLHQRAGLKHSAALTWLELAVIRDSRIPFLFPEWLLAHDLITRGISVLLLSRLRVACEPGVRARIFPKARQL